MLPVETNHLFIFDGQRRPWDTWYVSWPECRRDFYKGVEYGVTGRFEHTQNDCAALDLRVGHSGLEPETSVLSGLRSNQLS